MIKVLAVDDEPLALQQLKIYISKVPFLELVGACSDVIEAAAILRHTEVDAMFLDINMPDLSGMEWVRGMSHPPLVVFTTAYAEYAVEGFRVNAVDYLLKPFGLGEFVESSNRLKQRLQQVQTLQQNDPSDVSDSTLFLKTGYKIVRVQSRNIVYAEAMSEYLKVYVVQEPHPVVVLTSVGRLLGQLPPDRFLRLHRSFLVNLDRIVQVSRHCVWMDNGKEIPLGNAYKSDFRTWCACHGWAQ